jgi:lysozyme
MLKKALAALAVPVAVSAAVACSGAVSSSGPTSQDDALSVCAAGSTVKGIDVSYYQATIDWDAVKSSGHDFAFIRVSDGTKVEDPRFDTNWAGARDAGVVRGAYQYFRPSEDPVEQANLLVRKIGTLEPDDLPPVLDVEITEGVSALRLQQRVHTWLVTVEAATGRTPLVYTMAGMSGSLGTQFTAYPLWVANWGVKCPRMPSKWSGWKFWQGSDRGSVPGIHEKVDTDVFNGTMDDLQAFIVETGGGSAAGDAGVDSGIDPTPAGDAGAGDTWDY